ncbi:hypothetical protein [Endozoicomonas sp. ALC013]|uniref:hypothetical protein n=1 Tax=Endozoicomonas sp. ALC013 TaxID=3403076 RepID=UPI003BB6D49C
MNLSTVKPSDLTTSNTAAFISEQSSTSENYHSSQIFIPKGDQPFDLQRLLSSRKVIKNDSTAELSIKLFGKNFLSGITVFSDKPENAFWTSTLKKETTTGKNTTAWIEWCRVNPSNSFLGKTAAQFQVLETANIFHIDSNEKYKCLLKEYPHPVVHNYVDWERVAINFDAVHCTQDFRIPSWDCESTAWFNKDKLVFLKSLNSQEIDL